MELIMAVGMIGSIVAGGAQAANQKNELCASISKLQNDMNDYVSASRQTLAAYNQVSSELKTRLFDLQSKIAENSAKIKEQQASFADTYKYSQYICMGVFIGVAFLLFLKYNKVLTLNPFENPPPMPTA